MTLYLVNLCLAVLYDNALMSYMTIMVAFGLSLLHSSLGIGYQNEIVGSFIRQETKDYFNLEVSHVEGGLAAPTPIFDIWFFLWNLLLYLLKHYILHVHANLDWLACWPPLSYYNGKGKFELRSDSKHRGDHHSQSPPHNSEFWALSCFKSKHLFC